MTAMPSRRPRCAATPVLALALAACAPTVRAPARPEPAESTRPLERIELGAVVPGFSIASVDGRRIESAKLVGKRPFAVVFFSTWCPVCDRKLPVVRAALERAGAGIFTLLVSMDEQRADADIAGYLARHELGGVLVRGDAHARFAQDYNPFGAFPLVLVVDRSGVIAELQLGERPGDREALEHVLRGVMGRADVEPLPGHVVHATEDAP